MSTRRIPKGPGRRPKSLARQQFMELLAQGVPLRVACLEVGVSRSTGQIWKNGTTVPRRDGTVKVVPPLEPLAVRPISPRFLSEEERVQIADMASRGLGPTAIGSVLGRAPSTISRELRRNLHPSGQYRPFHAQAGGGATTTNQTAEAGGNDELRAYVIARLSERWSPQQIARALRSRTRTSVPAGGDGEDLSGAVPASERPRQQAVTMRTGRDHRRAHARQIRAGRRFAQPMLSVHDRGFEPTDRSTLAIGRVTSSSDPTTAPGSARWWNDRPATSSCCTCRSRTRSQCTPPSSARSAGCQRGCVAP